jgi:hypothetical protein
VVLGVASLAETLGTSILILNLEVDTGGVIEQEVHVQGKEIGDPEEHRLFDAFLLLGQKIQGEIEVMELEALGLGPIDLLEPTLIEAQLAVRGQGPVRHQQEGRLSQQDRGGPPGGGPAHLLAQAQAVPEGTKEVEAAILLGPLDGDGLAEGFGLRFQADQIIRAGDAEDALGQAAYGLDIEVLLTAEVVDDAGLGALLLGIPDTLGELEVADGGAVAVVTLGGAYVHA